MRDPRILVIIPTYGHFNYVTRCVESLYRYTPSDNFQLLIVDDASPDWSAFEPAIARLAPNAIWHRYTANGGLTRSWNYGLRLAKHSGYRYAVAGNSDILFTPGWYASLVQALDGGYDLVGPITNAPGHAKWQAAQKHSLPVLDDSWGTLEASAAKLQALSPPAIPCRFINGFFMMARSQTWWRSRFDNTDVFNPINRMVGNENEFQTRLRRQHQGRIAFCPGSLIFHYRSVSRKLPLKHPLCAGAYRMS